MKKVIASTITDRGQLTVPAEIRRLLGVQKGRVEFVISEGIVTLRPPAMTLEEAFGALGPVSGPQDWSARIREAKEEKAEKTIRKMRAS